MTRATFFVVSLHGTAVECDVILCPAHKADFDDTGLGAHVMRITARPGELTCDWCREDAEERPAWPYGAVDAEADAMDEAYDRWRDGVWQ